MQVDENIEIVSDATERALDQKENALKERKIEEVERMAEERERKRAKFDDDDDDPEKIEKILSVVSEKVPKLLNDLADVLYGKDRAAQYGKAVAAFYKELRDAGMSDQQAYTLTQEYMSAMNIGKMMGGSMAGLGGAGHSPVDGDALAKEINEKVRQKVEIKLQKKFGDKKADTPSEEDD